MNIKWRWGAKLKWCSNKKLHLPFLKLNIKGFFLVFRSISQREVLGSFLFQLLSSYDVGCNLTNLSYRIVTIESCNILYKCYAFNLYTDFVTAQKALAWSDKVKVTFDLGTLLRMYIIRIRRTQDYLNFWSEIPGVWINRSSVHPSSALSERKFSIITE